MVRRSNGLRNSKGGVQARPKLRVESLDYHEGLSANQVKIILREFGFNDKQRDEFNEWMYGQTCPIITRHKEDGSGVEQVGGVYEYDLFRWIEAKRTKVAPVWD